MPVMAKVEVVAKVVVAYVVKVEEAIAGRVFVLRKGARQYHLVRIEELPPAPGLPHLLRHLDQLEDDLGGLQGPVLVGG